MVQSPGNDQEYSLSADYLSDLRITFQTYAAHRRVAHPHWAYPEHEHPLFELNMVSRGVQQITVAGRRLQMKPGDIMLIQPNVKHESRAMGGEEMEYCCIHFDMDDPHFRQKLRLIREPLHQAGSPFAAAAGAVLKQIGGSGEMDGMNHRSRLDALRLSFELFSMFSRLLAQPPEGLFRDSAPLDGLAGRLAERLIKAVEEQPDADGSNLEAVSLGRIAKEFGYSPAYCSRVFKNVFGMSLRAYLSMFKLKQAKLLLLDRELSIEQVSLKLGYKDMMQFSKQFKRWMGVSPSQYRQMI